jgi:alpha-D-ribose 1-methylphosphonate 5-triphosphate synthase subunit PhnH
VTDIAPGDAVRRNQIHFRALLQALARPGRLHRLAGPLHPWPAMALAECLLDHEVSFCLPADPSLQAAVAALTGARPETPENADFIFVSGPRSGGLAGRARRGGAQDPEGGATIVYCLDALPPGAPRPPDGDRFRVRLSGPGIAEPEGLAPEIRGLDLEELQALQAANAEFPRGVDAFFLRAGGDLMALPRSTRIRVR